MHTSIALLPLSPCDEGLFLTFVGVYLELFKTIYHVLVFADRKRSVVLSFSSWNTFLAYGISSSKCCLSATIRFDFPGCLLLITTNASVLSRTRDLQT